MPKIFSGKDRDTIRETLIQLGLNTLSQKGYKATSIEDVAREVGIAKGTFYNFFQSKEQFFYEAMIYIRDKRRQELLNFFSESVKINRESTEEFLTTYFQKKNVHHYFTSEELSLIFRKNPEQKEQLNKDSVAFADALVEKLHVVGSHINNEVVVNILNITADFAVDKKGLSIGSKLETIQFLAHAMSIYIFKEDKKFEKT